MKPVGEGAKRVRIFCVMPEAMQMQSIEQSVRVVGQCQARVVVSALFGAHPVGV
jgi:hypothetical protein